MSWNLQQPITSELAAAKANKDGTDFTNPATWRSGLDVVSTNETRRQGTMDYAAAVFDGATTSTRITSTLTGQNIGTGDFSLWARFRVPATAGGGRGIIQLSSPAAPLTSANGFDLYIRSGGSIAARINGATASDFRLSDGGNIITTYAGQVIDVVFTRTGSTVAMYINGTSVALTDTTGGTPPAWSGSITSTYCHTGAFDSTLSFFGRIYRSVVFNRALSAGDVTELITLGVNPADQWGTQTQVIGFNPAVLNGGFETNSLNASGTWGTVVAGTSTATIDTSGSFSRTGTNAGKLTLDASGSSAIFTANNNNLSTLAVNKRYRVSIWARKGATSGSCGVRFGGQAGGVYGDTGLTLTTTYANTVAEFVTVIDGSFTMFRLAGSAGLSEIYIDDVELTRIGAIVDLDLSVGIGLFFPDRSDNRLGGDGFGGISHSMPKEYGQITVVKELIHSDISSSLGTTLLFQLPPNCGIAHVEFDRVTAMDAGVTLEVGTAATGTKFAAATAASATGIIGAASASMTSESNSANTPIYLRKSGATSMGRVRVRVTYSIRG